jgi:uncharacterized FlaG/YvyC family protein
MADKDDKRKFVLGEARIMELNKINTNTPAAMAVAVQENRFQTNPETVQAVTAVNNTKLFGQDSELTFAMDRETRRTVIRLVDRNTRKVIRQIPADYVLNLAAQAQKEQ